MQTTAYLSDWQYAGPYFPTPGNPNLAPTHISLEIAPSKITKGLNDPKLNKSFSCFIFSYSQLKML